MVKKEKAATKNVVVKKYGDGGGAVYGVGLIGALVYYISNANTFVEGVIGVLKALVWPAFLVYSLLDFFKL